MYFHIQASETTDFLLSRKVEMEEILLESDAEVIPLTEFTRKCRRVWE